METEPSAIEDNDPLRPRPTQDSRGFFMLPQAPMDSGYYVYGELYKKPVYTNDAVKKQVRRKRRPPHWGDIGESYYVSEDGGPRLQRSVIYCRSCHGYAVNETQKPQEIVAPLIEYSVPVGGVVIDLFAGSGTTLVVARQQGKKAIGFEKRESQCEEIAKRLSKQPELQLFA